MPEFMAYMATIVKCVRDFEGLAWAQYDRAYRRHVAQAKTLQWSRLNPTIYSLCFAGKAKKNVVCSHCLSDSHASVNCPENMTFPWQGLFTGVGYPQVAQQAQTMSKPRSALQTCHLYNARDGPRCTYANCKFAHRCAACKGPHARYYCRQKAGGEGEGAQRKRPQQE